MAIAVVHYFQIFSVISNNLNNALQMFENIQILYVTNSEYIFDFDRFYHDFIHILNSSNTLYKL